MMKWQRSIGLVLAGLGLAVFALWFTQVNTENAVPAPKVASTNAAAIAARQGATNNLSVRPGLTNAALARTVRTNAVGATNIVAVPGTQAPSAWRSKFQELSSHPWFYPVAAAVPLALGVLFLLLSSKPKPAEDTGRSTIAVKPRRGPSGTVPQCNVALLGPDAKKVWQFHARGRHYHLHREHAVSPGVPLPANVAAKDWRNLFQKKLNIAWIPADQVFLRVIHLPEAGLAETVSMVELQLEKLSPMPVAQVAWTLQFLPHSRPGMLTVVVVVVPRSVVEEFLGKLESEGYLADRLELPFMDQLQSTQVTADGAWVFPEASGEHNTALVAWFYGKVLQNLDLVTPMHEDRAGSLREQLTQMAWAGELEGWLTSPPTWHLVAEGATAEEWEPLLSTAMEQPIEVVAPVPAPKLAAATAERVAEAGTDVALLPPEYVTRYQQQFVDRLWMRALAAAVVIYLAGFAVYMLAVQVAAFRTRAVENQVAQLGPTYTNAMLLKAQYQVLKDRQELKYAGLDCWKAVAENLPENLSIDNISFSDGKRLLLQGTAPMGQAQQIYAFEGAMRKVLVNGQSLFDPIKGESVSYRPAPGGQNLSWSFALDLRRAEIP